jgi:zinc transporter
MIAEQMNQRMYVLSIVAAIFLPLGFLTGLFGINVGGIPGAEYRFAFWVFILILAILVGMQFLVFRKNRWF